MLEIRRTLCFAVLLVSLLIAAHSHAGDNSCTIVAPAQNDRWVKIYDADGDGDRGKIIWKGKIEAGQKVPVTSTNGHIRYQYAPRLKGPYQGDTSAWCDQNNTILLP